MLANSCKSNDMVAGTYFHQEMVFFKRALLSLCYLNLISATTAQELKALLHFRLVLLMGVSNLLANRELKH